MSNTIKLKRSSTAGATPTAGSLEYGELALNYTDGNLFFKTAANVVTLLASTKIANYSGNVNAGNLSTGGSLNVTGNANVGNIGATNVVATNISGTLTTALQTNITSLGTLTALSVTGNTIVGNISVDVNKFIDVGNNRVMNVAEPVANTDAATKSYVDTITSSGFTIQDDVANTTVVSAGDTLQLYGTANEVTVEITNTDQVTFGLPDDVTVTGNISANYYSGNGSQLTGIAVTSISNGNSNVAISSAGANVTMGITGTANTVVISPGSIFVNGVFATPKTITSNVQIAADSSAMVISPLTIGNGYSMSIPTSSTVYVWIPS